MPGKKNDRELKNLPSFSEEQDLDGFDGDDARALTKSGARSMGSRSSGGGSRKSRDMKKSNSRSSKQDSKIGSSTIEKVSNKQFETKGDISKGPCPRRLSTRGWRQHLW